MFGSRAKKNVDDDLAALKKTAKPEEMEVKASPVATPAPAPALLVVEKEEEAQVPKFFKIKSRSAIVQQSTKSQIAHILSQAADTATLVPTDLQMQVGTFAPSQSGGLPRIGFQGLDSPKGEVFSDKAHSPLNLVELHTQLLIAVPSNYAKTTVLMTFLNTTDKVLEGELEFPLPDKSTVCGFGLDVDGEIVCKSVYWDCEILLLIKH